ncbi:hypothetical protein PIB30_092269 [Stylosanthes scabra]|uniref:Zinc finger GRF-type domain-containing protein n=1 Tax=Stylosanthes scabra TaxID=79078 RepID=A0ABU6QU68_9FABA|nr:hypothetical protein [Stylosanthes scabra]
MESEGVSSGSRPSVGGGRMERSSSTQGVFAAKAGDDKDGAAPKCKCWVYIILYLSRTVTNPNMLFFRCPFFKAGLPHCKFFLWLDKHTEKLRKTGKGEVAEEKEDVSEYFSKIGMENRVADIENRLAAMEKNRKLNPGLILGLLLGFVAIYVTGLGRV